MRTFTMVFRFIATLVLTSTVLLPQARAEDPAAGVYRGCLVTLKNGSKITGYVFHSYHGQYYWTEPKTFPEIVFKYYRDQFKAIKNLTPLSLPYRIQLYGYTLEDEETILNSEVNDIQLTALPLDKKVGHSHIIRMPQEIILTMQKQPVAMITKDEGYNCPDPRILASYNPDIGEAKLDTIWVEKIRGTPPNLDQRYPFEEDLKKQGVIHLDLFSS